MRKHLFFSMAFFALGLITSSLTVTAQPVLTSADFGQNFYCVVHSAGSNGNSGAASPFSVTFYALQTTPSSSISVPLSMVPNAANFPTATEAVRTTSSSGISYTLYETTESTHKKIASGNATTLTANNSVLFTFPFVLNNYSSMGSYSRYGNVTTPYGNYSNVIRLYSTTTSGTLTSYRTTYVATNPYRIIGEQYSYADSGGGGTAGGAYVYEYLPYSLATDKFDKDSFSIYPNPTHGDLSIYYTKASNTKTFASVYDVLGKALIVNQKLSSDQQNISLKDMSSGLYIVKITDEQNQVLHTEKIFKN